MPTLTLTKGEIVRAVRAQRRATLELLRPLEPAKFDTPTALPGWRIREVVAHLISLDVTSFTGQVLPAAMRPDRIERWNDEQVKKRADRPVGDLLQALERWGRRFVRFARAVPAALYRTPLPTLWGRGPGGLLIWSRAYDEWVHRQDMRRALGLPDQIVDLTPVAEFALNAMVVNTLPRLSMRTGRVSISLEGTPIAPWTFDLTTRTGAPASEPDGDARIAVPAHVFVMAAAGRDAWTDLIEAGTLRIDGDEELARTFLGALKII